MFQPVTTPTNTFAIQPQQPEDKLPEQNLQGKTEQVSSTIICNACKIVNPKASLCGRCKSAHYCNSDCQKKDWKLHKLICSSPKINIPIDLSSFKSKRVKIGNQQILVYSLDSAHSPKNSLFELSDFAESLGYFVMNEFVRQLEIKLKADSSLRNTDVPIPSSQMLKLYTGPLNGWIEEAATSEHSDKLLPLSKLKAFIEKYFNQPGHEALRVPTGNLMDYIKTFHGDLVIELWLESVDDYSDYSLKNILKILKVIPKCELSEMNCVAFAFLMVNEKDFSISSDSYLSTLLKNLRERNYYPVTEPQEGDFVVYFEAVKNTPSHIGFLTSSGKVCSKPGFGYPFAVEHPLNHFSALYGKGGIAFFRKTMK